MTKVRIQFDGGAAKTYVLQSYEESEVGGGQPKRIVMVLSEVEPVRARRPVESRRPAPSYRDAEAEPAPGPRRRAKRSPEPPREAPRSEPPPEFWDRFWEAMGGLGSKRATRAFWEGQRWWTLLERPTTRDAAEKVYRRLARTMHPDRGGSHEAMVELNAAIETARRMLT